MKFILKKIVYYCGLIFVVFFSINIIISLSWSIYLKLNKIDNAYNKTQLELLNISQKESIDLFKETWIKRRYVYDQFLEYKEKERDDGKFVNISSTKGRKIKNNKDCKKNFFFYGSSMTFGYNVKDTQTFSQLFKDMLDEKYHSKCVFNYGRAGYGSTQENILFLKHIIENKIKKNDFIFFLNGAAERGIKKGINTDYLTYTQNLAVTPAHYKFIGVFKFFWDSLPLNQFLIKIKERFFFKDQLNEVSVKKTSLNEIVKVFEKNIQIRNSICKIFQLNCYTFIHPQSGLHGVYFENFNKSNYPQTGTYDFSKKRSKEMIKKRLEKFNEFIKVKNVKDLSIAFSEAKKITYIDRNHYSPYGHSLIAETIFEIIKKNLK